MNSDTKYPIPVKSSKVCCRTAPPRNDQEDGFLTPGNAAQIPGLVHVATNRAAPQRTGHAIHSWLNNVSPISPQRLPNHNQLQYTIFRIRPVWPRLYGDVTHDGFPLPSFFRWNRFLDGRPTAPVDHLLGNRHDRNGRTFPPSCHRSPAPCFLDASPNRPSHRSAKKMASRGRHDAAPHASRPSHTCQ